MHQAGLTQRSRRIKSVAITMAASVALVITVAATNSVVSAARSITRDSSALSETDGAIRSATVARTLTILAAVAVQEDSPSPSLVEVRAAIKDLSARSNPAGLSPIFVNAVEATLTQLQANVTASPQQVAAVENSFQDLLNSQLGQRANLASALDNSQNRLNRMSTLAGVALLFLVPAAAIFVYRGLTKPDLHQARLIHEADLDRRSDSNRRATIAKEIARIRDGLDRYSKAELNRRMAELSALAGPGFDGVAHDRMLVDVRGSIAKAMLRLDSTSTITVSGDMPLAVTDETNLVTLVALLLDCVNGLESPAVVVKQTNRNVVISISGIGTLDASTVLGAPRLWDNEPDTGLEVHLAAARALAEIGGARIRQLTKGERSGFKILVAGAERGSATAARQVGVSATAA